MFTRGKKETDNNDRGTHHLQKDGQQRVAVVAWGSGRMLPLQRLQFDNSEQIQRLLAPLHDCEGFD
jgi:hypothetical protein